MSQSARQTTRRIAAILVADVVGYSRLVELDEGHMLSAMRSVRTQILDPLIAQHQGRIVKMMGDGALVEFSSVVDAVRCAIAIQSRVAADQARVEPERRIVFRMGINLGDVVVDQDDLLGDGVNIAARLEQLCDPGGILVSGTAYDQLHGKVEAGFQFIGEQKMRKLERKVRVYRVKTGETRPVQKGGSRLALVGAAAGICVLLLALGAGGWWLMRSAGAPPAPTETAALDTDDASGETTGPSLTSPPAADTRPKPTAAELADAAPALSEAPPAKPAGEMASQPAPLPATEAAAPAPAVAASAIAQAPPAPPPTASAASEPPLTISSAPAEPPAPIGALAAATAPAAVPALNRVAELRRYVRQFDGGNCFFAMPVDVTEGAAKIEAYSESVPPVQALDDTFRRTNGFEAQIGLRQVTAAQCAAIEFLHLAETEPETAPNVALASLMLQSGEPLLGKLADSDGRSIAVLLVADDGAVHDLSDTIEGPPGSRTFRVKLTSSKAGAIKPLLLMVIASPMPLTTLSSRPLPHADRLFPLLAAEAKRTGLQISAALKYLKLQG
jgi:class 3 adenylate cyclase